MKGARWRSPLQHFNDCPNWLIAIERIERAIEATDTDAEVHVELVNTPEAAEAAEFRGSPTILINGIDPFANPHAPIGLSCRVYITPDGMAGAPTIEQITDALARSTP